MTDIETNRPRFRLRQAPAGDKPGSVEIYEIVEMPAQTGKIFLRRLDLFTRVGLTSGGLFTTASSALDKFSSVTPTPASPSKIYSPQPTQPPASATPSILSTTPRPTPANSLTATAEVAHTLSCTGLSALIEMVGGGSICSCNKICTCIPIPKNYFVTNKPEGEPVV